MSRLICIFVCSKCANRRYFRISGFALSCPPSGQRGVDFLAITLGNDFFGRQKGMERLNPTVGENIIPRVSASNKAIAVRTLLPIILELRSRNKNTLYLLFLTVHISKIVEKRTFENFVENRNL